MCPLLNISPPPSLLSTIGGLEVADDSYFLAHLIWSKEQSWVKITQYNVNLHLCYDFMIQRYWRSSPALPPRKVHEGRLQKSSWLPYPKLIVCSEIALEGVRWYSTPWNALSRCADFYGSSKWFIPLRLCMSNKHWELLLVNSITVRWFWIVIEV